MKLPFLRISIVVAWLLATGWLVRYEAFPESFAVSLSGYRSLLPEEILLADTWMRIRFRNQDIGFCHTSLDVNESDPVHYYEIKTRGHIALRLMGQTVDMFSSGSVSLTRARELRRFSFLLSSREHNVRVAGSRAAKETFDVEVAAQGVTTRTQVRIPSDVVLFSPTAAMAVRHLKPGQQATLAILDPLSLRKSFVTLRALRRERVTVAGESCPATVLTADYQGMGLVTWVDASGAVLRQETPFGISLEKCTPEEAMAAVREPRNADDLLRALGGQLLGGGTLRD